MESLDKGTLETILNKKPQTWTNAEAQAVCQDFIRAWDDDRTSPNPWLTTQLWRYWFLTLGEKPLMSSPEYNMALMVSAQAFGEFVPESGDSEFFGQYRQEHADLEMPLATPHLIWGPRASMNLISGPTLSSAVLQAYVFRTNDQIEEILIIGQGPPEIRDEILQASLACMLNVQAGDLDMINSGACRIFVPGSHSQALELPGITTLGRPSLMTSPVEKTTGEALRELVRKLRLLQERTELVLVHDADVRAKQGFDGSLRTYAQKAFRDEQVIVVAHNPENLTDLVGWATLAPYYYIAQRPVPLHVVLPPDILKLRAFDELLDAFMQHTVERIRADARVRQESYQRHVDDLIREQVRWRTADERTRREVWGEHVWVSEHFDPDTGVTIRMPPKQIPVSEYMMQNVPTLIVHYRMWAERMDKIIRDIEHATRRTDTPVLRLTASRFLDAVLREDREVITDETLRRPFDRWCAQVAPFLRHLWRAKMKVRGIRPESIFTPHTIFHTRFQVDDHNTVIGLAMQPFTLMSPTHSVVVFDPQQRVLLAHDPSDYARTFVAEAGPTPSELWQELEHITTRPGAMQEDFTTYLHKSLSIWPFELLPKTVEHLSPRRNPDVNDSWETNSLLQQRSELAEQIRLAVFPSKLVTLLNQHAFHSARSLIQTTRVPLNQKACLFLWHVLVECLAISESPNIFIPSLAHSNEVATQAESAKIAQLLYQAQQFDSRLVREWVEKLAGSQDLQPAVSLLQRDWMRLEQYLTTLQLQTLYKASSSAQTAFLARELESVSRTITSDGESTATVLAKIGFSLTSLLLSDAGVVPFSDVRALLEILVGEQSQSFNSSQADV